MKQDYEDILYLPHHRSAIRSHMSLLDRAAQFSPFAALTGFESAIAETGRYTQYRPEYMEHQHMQLDQTMQWLIDALPRQPVATVTYFIPDQRKSGGHFETVSGGVLKIDLYRQVLTLSDAGEIPMDAIVSIETPDFPEDLF